MILDTYLEGVKSLGRWPGRKKIKNKKIQKSNNIATAALI